MIAATRDVSPEVVVDDPVAVGTEAGAVEGTAVVPALGC
jgi:hypothetical protein